MSFNDEGILEWNFLEPENAPPRPDGVLKVGGSKSNVDITIDGHVMLLRDLKEAVEEDRQPMIPPEDGQRAVKVICGIYKSSSTGAPVGDRI